MSNSSIKRTLAWITIFAIAMGMFETAVVIYLRKMFFPEGFNFPLVAVDTDIALVEFCREAATIIMLIGVGILAGKTPAERFAWFIYAFAIWDIFYYVFLKVFLDWPASLFTWDILFLIPVPWVGPVIAPVLVALTMILLAGVIIHFSGRSVDTRFLFMEKLLFVLGALIIIISFVWDYFGYMSEHTELSMWAPGKTQDLFVELARYSPRHYNWWMFSAGMALGLGTIFMYFKRLSAKCIPARSY